MPFIIMTHHAEPDGMHGFHHVVENLGVIDTEREQEAKKACDRLTAFAAQQWPNAKGNITITCQHVPASGVDADLQRIFAAVHKERLSSAVTSETA